MSSFGEHTHALDDVSRPEVEGALPAACGTLFRHMAEVIVRDTIDPFYYKPSEDFSAEGIEGAANRMILALRFARAARDVERSVLTFEMREAIERERPNLAAFIRDMRDGTVDVDAAEFEPALAVADALVAGARP